MDVVTAYLPPHDGLLPKWLLFVSLTALGNSIQAYLTTSYTARVYLGSAPSASQKALPEGALSPVTPLSSRTFGTWTFLSAVIRLYGAYYIDNPLIYQLTLWTYALAGVHFFSEWLVFGTARWGKGLAGPVFVSTGSIVWMVAQWGYYVK